MSVKEKKKHHLCGIGYFAGSVVRLSANCLFCVCMHVYWHILDVANRHQVSKDLDHSALSHRWRCGAGYILNKDKLRQTLRHCQWLTLKRRTKTTTKSQTTVEMSCILTVGSAVLSCAALSVVVVFHCFVCALLFLTVVRLWTLCNWTGLLVWLLIPGFQECVGPVPYSCDSELCTRDVDVCVAIAENIKKDCICSQNDRLGS